MVEELEDADVVERLDALVDDDDELRLLMSLDVLLDDD